MILLFAGIGVSVLCSYFAAKPDGVYFDRNIGAVGGAYWTFGNGQIQMRTQWTSDNLGAYSKSNGTWIANNGQCILQPSLLGMKIVDTSNSGLDQFLPRKGFMWLFDIWARLKN